MSHRTLSVILAAASVAFAQIPDGYYDAAQGLNGEALQWALHGIIDNHDAVSYSYIWTAFYTTDDIYGNKVWDMYSDIPGGTPPYLYTLGEDQGGSASGEGQGYNREHSWPKSWFGDSSPMNTDLFHIVPSDIYVNNRRSNYPFAEVSSTTWVSQNGSRLGTSCTPGYSGTAFEPVDGYKGDFARIYFYMATRYKGEDSGWPGSAMADGADLEDWAVDMLLQWHEDDPVSDKEIDRNNAVHDIQDNRNPFVDHPEYAQMIYNPTSGTSAENEGIPSDAVFCFPNPGTGSITVSVSASLDVATLVILDAAGRRVADLTSGLNGSTAQWDCSAVTSGVYFAVAATSENTVIEPVLVLSD